MIHQTKQDGFQIIRRQRSQSRLQRRCLAGPVIGIDDYFSSLNLDPWLDLLGLVPEHDGDALEPGLAQRLHDRFEECAATIGKSGLGGSHAGGFACGENQSGDHVVSTALGLYAREGWEGRGLAPHRDHLRHDRDRDLFRSQRPDIEADGRMNALPVSPRARLRSPALSRFR